MGRWIYLAMMLLIATAAQAYAQASGRIVGRVTGADGRSLPGIQITVTGTTRGAISDSAGRYTIANVPAGQRIVQARAIGYATATDTIAVSADQAATANFTLSTSAA